MQERRFDARAATWDENPKRRAMQEALAKAIINKAAFTPAMRLLDYGCGTGLLSFPLAAYVASVTGMDISEGMLEEFRKKAALFPEGKMRALRHNLLEAPPLNETFECIVSAMALHHMGDIEKVLQGLRAMLAEKGRLFLADLDTEPALFHGPDPAAHGVFHFGFDRAVLSGTLKRCGFKEVDHETAYVLRRPVEGGTERDFPIFLITAMA